jgi:DNA-binding MarR family transcriptional regulator
MSDVVRTRGVGAFGTRLRRLSERLDRDIREIYRIRGIEFEPSWFPLFAALDELGPLSVGEVAAHTGVSHAAISQMRGKLLAEALIEVKTDAADQRRQMLHLTAKGRALVTRVRPLWRAIADATKALCSESAPNILSHLDAVEIALDINGMHGRVNAAEHQAAIHSKAGRKKPNISADRTA